ncbi:cytochrome p450 [Lentinula edodes]|uniref:Cytochrome p450 n=1 Tax=Lentinula edodes TaxID=5353 RepID=A0A1Q3DWK3_LENED|nr:cytochrome p450 [Lentinula edodes]
MPPGPQGWPLIGNLLDLPTAYEWEIFAKWGERWGDLLSVSIFGTTVVVINSYKRCQEMLDKKSNVYSDRPYVPMAMELIEMRDSMGFLPYDKRFKSSRRLFHQELGSNSAVQGFFPQEEQLGKKFVRRVLRNPDGLLDHCFQHAGAIILRVAYGYEAEESNDPFVNIANTAMDNFNRATAPGAFLVNQMPILLKVPDWFPGTEWKRIGRAWAKDYWAMVDVPFNFVKKQLAEGTAEDSFTAKWLKQKLTPQEELDLKFASSSMFGAGAETTAVTVHVFFLLMAMFPEVQRKAQNELESVIGKDRLPSFEDRDRLTYVEAVCKEVMRYHAVVPNGLPHCTAADDIHDGMFIPKGAIIFANIWNMTHDPEVYKNPMEFNPERFLGESPEQDPKDMVFGFGRRICPGRLLGDASVFITLAMSLAAFDIAPCDGEPPLSLKNKSGIVSHLHPFKCEISPRMDIDILSALVNYSLYHPSHFDDFPSDSTLEDILDFISGVLRLSSKYMIHSLRRKCIAVLTRTLPATLEDYDSRTSRGRSTSKHLKSDVVMRAIRLAQETNVTIVLPFAYYCVARLPSRRILEDQPDDMTWQQKTVCLYTSIGQPKMQEVYCLMNIYVYFTSAAP